MISHLLRLRVGSIHPRLHGFQREYLIQIASMNSLERGDGEIKRRSDVIGFFPNYETVAYLVGALMLDVDDKWRVAWRYMSLECLARATDATTVKLSAVAT